MRVLQKTTKVSPTLMARWQEGDPDAPATVEAALAQQGLTWDAVMGEVLVSNLTEFEQIERLIASTDARWERALSNIARRQEALAQSLRHMAGCARQRSHEPTLKGAGSVP
ncbi:hypothetical protein [Microvirga arabica]|uniref:hypothetical protein n=1 Tax=Microvirga arabica TaxID=1128671 RepID=UPI00193A8ABC|nr:hypothetical protein [Microvirga arabica]MBM1171285.1 hypothetical protein [Microvirga arabica]